MSPQSLVLHLERMTDPAPTQSWTGSLSPAERSRAARFRRPPDRARYLERRAAIRRSLAGYLGLPAAAAVPLSVMPSGRPVLDAPFERLCLSTAASGRWLALVLRPDSAVGVDIECLRSVESAAPSLPAMLSAGERFRLAALSGCRRDLLFWGFWAAREAAGKALGTGLFALFDRMSVEIDDDDPSARMPGTHGTMAGRVLVDADGGPASGASLAFRVLTLQPGLVVAIAGSGPLPLPRLTAGPETVPADA